MIRNFIKNRFADSKYLIWILRHIFQLKVFSITSYFLYWIIYPIPRLLFGAEKAFDIFSDIVKRFTGGKFILPLPIKSKRPYYIEIRDIGDFAVFREVCIDDSYNHSRLVSGMQCVDVGAHVGSFTLLASLMVGKEGKVIAIEPETKNFNQLIKNLKLNKIENVITKNIALSDINGKEDFFIDKGSCCHSFFRQDSSIDKIQVESKTLDTLLAELNINKINILKIDTEGSELKVLKGARETLLKNSKMKIIIAAEHYPEEISEVVEYLKNLNFAPKVYFHIVVV